MCTNVLYRLYIVEQGSTDDTYAWVKKYSTENSIATTLIRNNSNVGFPKGCNQAFAQLKDEQYVCLLNNDTIVSDNWAKHLIENINDQTLIVGPMTNRCGWRHQVLPQYKDITDISIEQVQQIGKQVEQNQGTKVLAHLSGFCMLFSRDTLEQYGPFDERFLLGGGEEVDFCWKVTTSGKQCRVVKYAYVHHLHHATFEILDIDMSEYRAKTSALLAEKWPTDKRPKF